MLPDGAQLCGRLTAATAHRQPPGCEQSRSPVTTGAKPPPSLPSPLVLFGRATPQPVVSYAQLCAARRAGSRTCCA